MKEKGNKKITDLLANQKLRVEVGCIVMTDADELLNEVLIEGMRTSFVYGVISNLEDVCEVTKAKSYQINWSVYHIDAEKSLWFFVAAYFEQDLEVVKLEDEEDGNENKEFSNKKLESVNLEDRRMDRKRY